MLYGQDVPIVNFLFGKAGETGLSARFRTSLILGGEKDYGTNWCRKEAGLERGCNTQSILDMKIRSTRTNQGIKENLISKVRQILRDIYTKISIKSRYTLTEEAAKTHTDLDVMKFVNTST